MDLPFQPSFNLQPASSASSNFVLPGSLKLLSFPVSTPRKTNPHPDQFIHGPSTKEIYLQIK